MLAPGSKISDFDSAFPDEAAAEAFLVRVRWPDGVCCAQCGSREVTRLRTRPLWQCRRCRAQTSVRSNTVLHGTRKPLRDWLYATWRCSTGTGGSARGLARELAYRYETAWVMLHKIRCALAERGGWQLQAPASLGTAALAAPKRSKGEPRGRPPVLVAIAAEDLPAPTGDVVRFETASTVSQTDGQLLATARYRHVEPRAEPRVEQTRLDAPFSRAPRSLAMAHRHVRNWLRLRFRGVSRRYMANYLAQFAYLENRWHGADRLFEWVARRVAWEAWLPRSRIALGAP